MLTSNSPLVAAPRRGNQIDWNKPAEVKAFVAKYKLPPPTYKEIGYFITHGVLPTLFYNKINAALADISAQGNKERDLKVAKMNAMLGKAQDVLVFDGGPSEGDLSKFLEKLETNMKAAIA